jgi:multiple sugar transport system ATP-binding protein
MNFAEASLVDRDGALAVVFGPHELAVPEQVVHERPELRTYSGRPLALGIRPEDIHDPQGAPAPPGTALEATVDIREDMGSEVYLHFSVDAQPVRASQLEDVVGHEALAAADEQTHHHGSSFIARVDRTSTAREGQAVVLSVATTALHFFDLETGRELRGASPRHVPLPPQRVAPAPTSN